MKLQIASILSLSVVGVLGISKSQAQSVTVDGDLDAAYGSTPLVTQINVSNSHGAGGNGYNATASTRAGTNGGIYEGATDPAYTQLSNAYAFIDSASNLHLFLGGSLQNYDSHVNIAIQSNNSNVPTTAGALTSLNGQDVQTPSQRITFDTGFNPNALIVVAPTYNGVPAGQTSGNGAVDNEIGNITYNDLTNSGNSTAASFVSAALDNKNIHTLIGTGMAGSPTFASIAQGLELSIPLASLGSYTAGTAIKVTAFVTENSGNVVNNQVLTPFSYFTDGGGNQTDSSGNLIDTSALVDGGGTGAAPGNINYGYDYSYIDNNRQFSNDNVYAGLQYFTVGGPAVPEPASLGLLAMGGLSLIRRRSNVTR